MRPHQKSAAVLAITVLFALADLARAADKPGPKVGDAAPAIALDDLQGNKIVLANLLKKSPVVVLFLRGYPGYQCPFCAKQVAQFVGASKQFKDAGAHVLLVYPGPSDGLKAHADEFLHGKTLPDGYDLVIDPEFTATEAWHLRWDAPKETAYPATYVVDTDDIIRFAKSSTKHGDRASVADVIPSLFKK